MLEFTLLLETFMVCTRNILIWSRNKMSDLNKLNNNKEIRAHFKRENVRICIL